MTAVLHYATSVHIAVSAVVWAFAVARAIDEGFTLGAVFYCGLALWAAALLAGRAAL